MIRVVLVQRYPVNGLPLPVREVICSSKQRVPAASKTSSQRIVLLKVQDIKICYDYLTIIGVTSTRTIICTLYSLYYHY